MGKPPKQFHEGYWYHVYVRSLEEVRLFETDDERDWFLEKLDETFDRRKVTLGALCLMDTHYHALVRMGPVDLDRVLNSLHMSYAKHINHERERRSSVFEKHPGTDIVLDDSYLLQLIPYIHNNPVEAGMVKNPQDYEYSTDRLFRHEECAIGPFECWEWPPYFKENDRIKTYRRQMDEYDPEEIPRSNDGYVGTEEEWQELEKRDEDRSDRYRDRRDRESMETIANRHAQQIETTVEDLKQPGRKQPEARIRQNAMIAMYEEGYGPTEIGDFFNRDKAAVTYAVRTYGEAS